MERIEGDQDDPKRGGLFDRKYRFTVKYVVPFDRLDEFVEAVKPFSVMVHNKGFKYHRSAQTKNQALRIRASRGFFLVINGYGSVRCTERLGRCVFHTVTRRSNEISVRWACSASLTPGSPVAESTATPRLYG
jgi:hypothetical protein